MNVTKLQYILKTDRDDYERWYIVSQLPTTMTCMSPRTGTLFWSIECFCTPPNSESVIPAVNKKLKLTTNLTLPSKWTGLEF